MRKNVFWVGGGIAALSIGLIALPSPSAALQDQEDASTAVKIERLPKVGELKRVQIDGDRISQDVERALEQSRRALAAVPVLSDSDGPQITVMDGADRTRLLG